MTARWLGGKRLDTRRGFWFVWCPDALRPSKQYSSLAAAQADADKLRARFPGREFLVYRAELVLGPVPDAASRGAATGPPRIVADAKTSPNVGRSSAPHPEPPKAERLGRPRLTLRREKHSDRARAD